MKLAYIALGSNLGVPEAQLDSAIASIATLPKSHDLTISPWYKSKAIGGPLDQPDYLNAVCSIYTTLSPDKLLELIQAIETSAGRLRTVRWGPRTLDLDLIWYEGFNSQEPLLVVPHPRAHLRAFVLKPLLDLNATFLLEGRPLIDWLNDAHEQQITLN